MPFLSPNQQCRSTRESKKTKIGTEVAHATRDSDTTSKVKRSKVNLLQGAWHIVAASRTTCLWLLLNSWWWIYWWRYCVAGVMWQVNLFLLHHPAPSYRARKSSPFFTNTKLYQTYIRTYVGQLHLENFSKITVTTWHSRVSAELIYHNGKISIKISVCIVIRIIRKIWSDVVLTVHSSHQP